MEADAISRSHFHIHWSDKESLDWERFLTFQEAVQRALELACPDETYMIEEFSANCPACEVGQPRRSRVASA
jgi:hypothetical protein